MKLITDSQRKTLINYGLNGKNDKGMDSKVVLKIFNPYGLGTWLFTSAEETEDGDLILYGYASIYEWEWGYTSLKELEDIRINIMGCRLPLERDRYSEGTVRELSDN